MYLFIDALYEWVVWPKDAVRCWGKHAYRNSSKLQSYNILTVNALKKDQQKLWPY